MLAVVANHLTGHPRGGFVGVDVFFVISGYLITGMLLRERGEGSLGRYLGGFYRRRIRRLLPSAMLVIAATILASRLVLGPVQSASIVRDGGWASIFWANWHFAEVGTNYFTASTRTSPLRRPEPGPRGSTPLRLAEHCLSTPTPPRGRGDDLLANPSRAWRL